MSTSKASAFLKARGMHPDDVDLPSCVNDFLAEMALTERGCVCRGNEAMYRHTETDAVCSSAPARCRPAARSSTGSAPFGFGIVCVLDLP